MLSFRLHPILQYRNYLIYKIILIAIKKIGTKYIKGFFLIKIKEIPIITTVKNTVARKKFMN
ncbi:hypothetical protein CHH58_12005 [Terribacillus saccharophilus]|nr:hypothetical protein CHH49_04810 [Terribacillus saccharophilus]PAF37526.1 hypothetical protein CHH58_12005 [Terribacillus saccharophilus]